MFASFLGLVAFLAALFLPPAQGGLSVFDQIVATIVGILPTAAAKGASFIDQIPAMIF